MIQLIEIINSLQGLHSGALDDRGKNHMGRKVLGEIRKLYADETNPEL
jgi:hypothetical protein